MQLPTNSPVPRPLAWLCLLLLGACSRAPAEEMSVPHVSGGTDVERGRYIVVVGGCNDCHTEGYLQTEGDIPEDQWLLGSQLGWRGPWGTTFPPNLRLTVQDYSEDEFVELLHTRTALPPMPWMNLNQMVESDARALFRYIASLGAAGEVMPAALPPDVEPTTPYLSLVPVEPGS
ncbi:MAG: cytochrome C [Gemmatimonadetes bacterium]|nr:cytochrome C [Gemmatimonadota bacterium]